MPYAQCGKQEHSKNKSYIHSITFENSEYAQKTTLRSRTVRGHEKREGLDLGNADTEWYIPENGILIWVMTHQGVTVSIGANIEKDLKN